ncbi:unnamed protein product (mitochondrion) [Plasmodiophora brassicae]|uniref:Uncharacterized protein n=1 Tax=Plasmodiophora brassicae TaxID=37360 RepID=A0A0G4J339_PLABS|nr:hypothetical protein PBRA_008588 [Plasmodiophora brassicae]SPQ99482.1 unnamed protein product [Plasmodiophora brassicae]
MQLPSSVVEHLRGNAGRRAASSFDNVEITIENDTGRATIAVQHANYIELVATGTPTAGRNPLPAYTAPAVSFSAGNRVLTAHQIKVFVRQLVDERTVAALVKRPEGWVLKKAADVNVPIVVYRMVRRLRGLSFKDELQAIMLGSKSTSFRKIAIIDCDNLSIVLSSIGGEQQASLQMPSWADHVSTIPLDRS